MKPSIFFGLVLLALAFFTLPFFKEPASEPPQAHTEPIAGSDKVHSSDAAPVSRDVSVPRPDSETAASASSVHSNTDTGEIFANIRNTLIVVGVLVLVASAFFGHFKWSWAACLLGGLALVAFVSQILSYFSLASSTP